MTIKFNDGEEFNVNCPLHAEHRKDGWYIVGSGLLIPVNSEEDADNKINDMRREFYK